MKTTKEDVELADRFPTTPGVYGHGSTMAHAKVNPKQLDRLLTLGLIRLVTDRGCGNSEDPGKGWRRNVSTYLRVQP